MSEFIWTVIILSLFAFIIWAYGSLGLSMYKNYQASQQCELWEKKTVWQESYVACRWIGRTCISETYPAAWVEREVCTKMKGAL